MERPRPPTVVQLTTDASRTGWGGHYEALRTHGFWGPNMIDKHSNVKELKAIYLSIKAFLPQLTGKTIQVLSDNITSVAYLNHMGGTVSELTVIAK